MAGSGFSLIELLFVVALSATLAAVAVPVSTTTVDEFRARAAARHVAQQVTRLRIEAVKRSAFVGLRFVAGTDDYTYAWSELGFRAAPWLRIGVVGQHTRTYGSEREFQRGPFAQVTWSAVTIGGYWFNPGADDQVFVAALGVKF